MIDRLRERLSAGRPVILDGAMGTELERRGYRTSMPLWSATAAAESPELVQQIHTDYLNAGAEIITANTFRTTAHTLLKVKKSRVAPALARQTVALASEAIAQSGKRAWLAGSIAPLEDCYRPELLPPPQIIESAYAHQLDILATTPIDLILAETMINCSEASILARLLSERTIPFMMSFTTDIHGNLLDGTPLERVAKAVDQHRPLALLVNCRSVDKIDHGLDIILRIASCPAGVYANGGGRPDEKIGWHIEEGSDIEYGQAAERWFDKGAMIVGGCCGTTPSSIREVLRLLNSRHRFGKS